MLDLNQNQSIITSRSISIFILATSHKSVLLEVYREKTESHSCPASIASTTFITQIMPRILSRTALPNMKRAPGTKRSYYNNLNSKSSSAGPRSQAPAHAGNASCINLMEALSLYDASSSTSSYYASSNSPSASSTPPHQQQDMSSTDDWGQYVDVSVHLTVTQSIGTNNRSESWVNFFS